MLPIFVSLFLILFIFFYLRPWWGFCLVFFFAPFIGLTIDFSKYQWSRQLPYLGQIQAPLADILVLLLLGAVILRIIINILGDKRKETLKRLVYVLGQSGWFYFLPFLIAGAVSLTNVSYDQFNSSLKYLLRPVLFFYVMWLFLPVYLIDTAPKVGRVIKIWAGVGFLAALWGLLSLFIQPAIFGFWQRVTPVVLAGWAPFTTNHNILAEVLVSAAPLAFFLFRRVSGRLKIAGQAKVLDGESLAKKFYFFAFSLIILTALLTFSRAAWLALLIQLLLYFWLKYFYHKKHWGWNQLFKSRAGLLLLAVIILPLFIYMISFSLSPLVRSSNATRLDLTAIAWTYFARHPWLGNGLGTFMPIVADTRLFAIEYGDPLDAHGVLQKVLAEEGILGLVTLAILLIWVIVELSRSYFLAEERYRLLFLCLFLSVAGSLVYQFFNTSYYNQHLWLPIGIALAARRVLNVKY